MVVVAVMVAAVRAAACVAVAAVVATVAADTVKKQHLCQALLRIKLLLSIGSARYITS